MPKSILNSPDASARAPIWDLPTRLFHWLLAGLIAFSWWSAEYHHDELHIWSGLAVLALLIFRILWGLVGSSTARFTSFVRGPKTVLTYFKGSWRGIGHNPLGAVSVVALLALIAAQVGFGLIASDEDGIVQGPLARLVSLATADWARGWHEELFDLLLLPLIALHVGAILVYRLLGKSLVKPMITGKGDVAPGIEPMRPAKPFAAAVCLAIALGITGWVLAGAPPL